MLRTYGTPCISLYGLSAEVFNPMFDLVMSLECDINCVDDHKFTCLHLAIASDCEGVRRILSVPGVDVNAQDENGNTPLHIALQRQNEEAVKMLLSHAELDPMRVNNRKEPPIAACLGPMTDKTTNCVNMLMNDSRVDFGVVTKRGHILSWCAKVHAISLYKEAAQRYPGLMRIPDSNGKCPAHLAAMDSSSVDYMPKNRMMTVVPEIDNRPRQSHYHPTCFCYDMFTVAVEMDPECINLQDNDGNTPLHLALFQAGRDQEAVVLKFLPRFNVQLTNKKGETILHIAARNGLEKLTDAILKMDSSILNAVNEDGNTALHAAAVTNHIDVANVLCSYKGIEKRIMNKYGMTPYSLVVYGNGKYFKRILSIK